MIGTKALVTGGSRGLGKAICHGLANQGATVTVLARNASLLQQVVQELPCDHHQSHQFIPLDLLDINQLTNIETRHFQDVSVLVNCAGMANYHLLSRTSNEEIINTLNLNLLAPMILSKMIYKLMLKLKPSTLKPSILNVSSVLSLPDYTLPGTAVYAALKAGLNGFTQSLSNEFRGRIRVNAVMPGLIRETDMGSAISYNGIDPVDIDTVVKGCLDILQNDTINGQCITIN